MVFEAFSATVGGTVTVGTGRVVVPGPALTGALGFCGVKGAEVVPGPDCSTYGYEGSRLVAVTVAV